jgi:site-specific DNA-methyltransferase (adenine-specific)
VGKVGITSYLSPHNLTNTIDTMKNQVILGDCLEVMKDIPDKSIDMILCDLPYGTTACKWDTIIPFEPLWEQYKRIIKDNGAIVLTASQPFTSALVMSNVKMFKYEWIWEKSHPTGFASAKYNPLKYHESVLVFSKSKTKYNPQMWEGKPNHSMGKIINGGNIKSDSYINIKAVQSQQSSSKFPKSIIKAGNPRFKDMHPTQKPVALFEYLIKTYTSVGDVVLDNTIGSGTTAVAAINTGRNWIGIEQDAHYCEIANERIKKTYEEKERLSI